MGTASDVVRSVDTRTIVVILTVVDCCSHWIQSCQAIMKWKGRSGDRTVSS